ncbi:MAG: hypothetical protein EOO09_05015 [Chitinophagaceae bacterium]|nr:MAG: hypothetical protein EOO09_05015 [Chitinophagaceae bacterium]
MKPLLLTGFLWLIAITCCSQVVAVDSVHPWFAGKELDGDLIRTRFDDFEPAFPTRKPTGKYNNIILSMFHSKKLYIHSGLGLKEKLPEMDSFNLHLDPKAGYAIQGNGPSVLSAVSLFDSLPMLVTAYGINPDNKGLFRFRVLLNQRQVLVPWTEPRFFSPIMTYYRYNADGSEQTQMAYLGSFAAPPGNSITVEVKNQQVPDTVYRISAVWIKRAPQVIGTFSNENLQHLFEIYKFQWKHDFTAFSQSTYYGDIELKPIDSLLNTDSIFAHNRNSLFFYLRDKLAAADDIEYNLIRDNDSLGWQVNKLDPSVLWLQDLAPGKYRLLMRYSFQRQTTSSFSFTILPAWYQATWAKIVAGGLALLVILATALLVTNRRQKARLRRQQLDQDLQKAEMQSIRSQFNPHFVFNALSSIQGLVTRNDLPGAHKYLGDFSTLLRNSLKESEKEYTSLSTDIRMMDNYLKLEQLRFGFAFTIVVDKRINPDATEVPVLLLQPVIENAIKHGISGMYDKGNLIIEYTKDKEDLVILVRDNGVGFEPDDHSKGHGLRLTAKRVDLINRTMTGQPVSWEIRTAEGPTEVVFILKKWLA